MSVVFGNFIHGDTRNPGELGGCLPTQLIDTTTWTYSLSDSTIAADNIEVWAQLNTEAGALVDPSLYTVLRAETGNIEGQGAISAIRFDPTGPNPTPYKITWRGVGTIDPSTNILVNDPVTMIKVMFIFRGNWTLQDFDPLSLAQAVGLAAAGRIPVHWVFKDDQAYGQILADLFENYLADVGLNNDGQLRITYQFWPVEPLHDNQIAEPYLDANQDVAGDDPENAVVYHLAQENLLNEVVLRWRHNWATDEQAAEIRYIHEPSKNAYHSRKAKNFTLKGIRLIQHLVTWGQLLLSPLVELPAYVTFPLKALLPYEHLQRGTWIALTWSAGPDVLGRGWDKRILRILETSTNYLDQTYAIKAFDSRLSVIPPQAAPMRAPDNSLWYLRINSLDGTLECVSTLSFPWIVSGAERSWVLRQNPANQNIWVHPSNTGVITSATGQPAGSGDAGPVDLVDRTFRHWDIDVGVGPTFAVTPRLRDLGVIVI